MVVWGETNPLQAPPAKSYILAILVVIAEITIVFSS